MDLTIANKKINMDFNYGYKEIDVQYDESLNTLWAFMRGNPRPSFTTSLLQELHHLYENIKTSPSPSTDCHPIDYYVLASGVPDIYNLGGDLAHFHHCIKTHDKDMLTAYAYTCLDLCYENTTGFGRDVTTISLLQGSAYGGGFEGALSCNIIVAEKGINIGFPEILFNLFPGMGAYTYLARRVEPYFAEQMITSGNTYSSDELFERGVIDVLTEPGEGVRELNDYIKKHRHQRHSRVAMQKARLRTYPVTLKELRDITDIWVEAALNLSNKDLKIMDRLVLRQSKLSTNTQIPQVA